MVERQPLYIEGLDDSDKGSKACYYGGKMCNFYAVDRQIDYVCKCLALLYVVSCLLSVGYWIYHTKTQTRSFGLSQENLGNKYGSIGN